MTPTMCFLCCAVTVLSILSCKAQLTPLLLPLSTLKAPLKPGLLGAPAARLVAANTAVNLLAQGAKVPKVPLGKPLGLSLAAKAAKLPVLPLTPPVKPVKSPKLKSTLLKSKIPKKASSVRLRSIGDEEGAEYLESLRSEEQRDTFSGEIMNQNSQLNTDSSNTNSNENSDHLFKPRSPDNIESVDEFDFLSRAANPTDGNESGFKTFIHKIEHGVTDAFKKIDEAFRPHSAHADPKEANEGSEIVTSPYIFNNQNERIVIDNNAMEEYMRGMNNEQGVLLNYPYSTENIESVRNAMTKFQERLAKMRNNPSDEDALPNISQNNEANTIQDMQKLMSQYVDNSTSTGKSADYSIGDMYNQQQMEYPYYVPSNGLEYNPEYDGIWNPYTSAISKMLNAYFGNGYSHNQPPSPYENELYKVSQSPSESNLYKRDSPTEDSPDSTIVPTLTRNSRQMSPMSFGGMPAGGIVNSALGLSQGIMGGDYGKISQAGVNLGSGISSTAAGNPMQMSPMNFGGMPGGGIVNSALDLSQGIMGGDYDKISKAGLNLGNGIASTATGGYYNPDNYKNANTDSYKNSDASKPQNMWNSANDLASSITNAAKNPNNVGSDQVFGSIDKIWNSANNLASNIGKDTSGNFKNSPLASLMNNKYSSSVQANAGNIYNSASNLASTITNVAKNPNQFQDTVSNPLQNLSKDRPIGSIFNSASNLAASIAKSTELGNQAKLGLDQLFKLNAANKATGFAGKVANSAVSTGTSGLNQLMGYNGNSGLSQLLGLNSKSYPAIAKSGVDMAKQIVSATQGQNYFGGPTYAGGFYPRDSQADNIWNSANSLASNIYDATKNPSMTGNQPFNAFYNPFNSIWSSATNLAQDITNTAMNNRGGGMPYYFY